MDLDFHIAYQKKLIETFQVLINIIESNNLNYFVCGGTSIGVERHHGLIPWDDDIDIFMPRKDYNRLIQMSNTVFPEGYDIVSLYQGNCYVPYAKFTNQNTTFWEHENLPILSGLFIDIFPLDYFEGSNDAFLKKWKLQKLLTRLLLLSKLKFNINSFYRNLIRGYFKNSAVNLLSLFVPHFLEYRLVDNQRKIDNIYASCNKSQHLVCFYGSYGRREYFETDWFSSYKSCHFSGFTVRVAKGNHEYLNNTYGDFMKLPPVEKQVFEHSHYYINLIKRVNIDEAKLDISRGIVEVYIK